MALLDRPVSAHICPNRLAVLYSAARIEIHSGIHQTDCDRSIHDDRSDDKKFLPARRPLGSLCDPCVLVHA